MFALPPFSATAAVRISDFRLTVSPAASSSPSQQVMAAATSTTVASSSVVTGQSGTDYCSTDKSYYNVGDTITISGHMGASNPYYVYDYKPNGSVSVRSLGNGPGSFSIEGKAVEPEGTRRVELWMAGIEIFGGAKSTMAPHHDVTCNTFTVGPAIQTTTIQTSQSSTQTSPSSTQTSSTMMSIIEQNQLLILAAAVLLAAVIIAVALRGRRKPTPTQPTRTGATPAIVYCEQCGTRNPTTNDFCVKCGTKLH